MSGNKGQKNELIKLHRLIMNINDPNVYIDHINNNPLDNRKCNLRICSPTENSFNKKDSGRNTSGILGVPWDKARNKWAPEIRAYNKRVHLGRYDSIEEAAIARMYAEKLVFKEFQNHTHNIDEYISKISQERVEEIMMYVYQKLKEKEYSVKTL